MFLDDKLIYIGRILKIEFKLKLENINVKGFYIWITAKK